MIWLYVFFFLARDFNTFDAAINGSLKKMFLESCKWGTLLRCFRRRTPVSQVPVQCQTMSDLVLTGSASVPAVFLLLVFICLWLTSVSIFGAGAWGAEGLELAELWTHKKNTRELGILHGRLMVSQLKGWWAHCQVPMALCGECTHSDNASIVCGILANVTPRYQDEKGCLYGSNLTCPNKCPTPSMIFHWTLQTSLEEWSINLGIGNQFGNWFGIKLIGNQSGNQIYRMAGFKNEPEHSSRCPLPPTDPHHTLGGCFPLTAHSSSWNEEEGTTAPKASSQILMCVYAA